MTLWTSAGRFWHIKGAAMEYSIYKLNFQSGVHFGTGTLNESTYTFQADQLCSALYIEALKLHLEQEFYNMVKSGRLLDVYKRQGLFRAEIVLERRMDCIKTDL